MFRKLLFPRSPPLRSERRRLLRPPPQRGGTAVTIIARRLMGWGGPHYRYGCRRWFRPVGSAAALGVLTAFCAGRTKVRAPDQISGGLNIPRNSYFHLTAGSK